MKPLSKLPSHDEFFASLIADQPIKMKNHA